MYYLHCHIHANISIKAMMKRGAAFYMSTQGKGVCTRG